MILPLKKNENSNMKLLIKERNQEKSLIQKNSYSEEDSITIINDDNFCVLNPYYKEYEINNNINKINLKGQNLSNNNDNISDESEIEGLYRYNSSNNIALNKNIVEEEQLRIDFLKEFTKLRPDKSQNFLERMIFDVNNRQIKENKMNDFIKRTKRKMNEEEITKSFNRLIEDANRRIEAKEKMKIFKEQKENEDIMKINNYIHRKDNNRKYNKNQWKDIYKKRFLFFLDNKNKKIKEKIIEKELIEKKKEDDLNRKYNNKKLPKKDIINHCKKLYSEYMNKKSKFNNIKNNIQTKNEKNTKDRLKRNKSLICNKKQKIRTNSKKMNKINKVKKEGYFTPPTLKSNIQFKIKGDNFSNKGKYSNIGVGSLSEAVINTFFVNQKNKFYLFIIIKKILCVMIKIEKFTILNKIFKI